LSSAATIGARSFSVAARSDCGHRPFYQFVMDPSGLW
jgi:hypothetical protein